MYKFLQNMQLICKYRSEYVHKNAIKYAEYAKYVKSFSDMQNM